MKPLALRTKLTLSYTGILVVLLVPLLPAAEPSRARKKPRRPTQEAVRTAKLVSFVAMLITRLIAVSPAKLANRRFRIVACIAGGSGLTLSLC